MKLSYNWLKEFVDLDLTPKETAEIITFLGIETNLVSSGDLACKGVITANVTGVAKHPQADKLRICSLTDGTNTYSVICGAPNVEAGQVVALATVGAELPGGTVIGKARIRGVESEGMICSEKELGLSDESNGIMVLKSGTPLGIQLKDALGQRDSILEIEIPTNRPDALSHWGIAREIATKLGKQVKLPVIYGETIPDYWKNITVLDAELCPRYIGIKISGIKVGPSPDWICDRLKKCGLRPINNIVDITNYVLLELGHPLHAFDLNKMKGGEIVVRRAGADEKILALDGREYKLSPEMLVIADGEKAQAIAGVMGGEGSGVRESTTDMILESALFKPQSIRKTSKTLNLSSDASYRFERGTGWTVCETAALRAAQLIRELAGGKIESKHDMFENPFVPRKIELRFERANKITGVVFNPVEITDILSGLGMKVTRDDVHVTAEIPSWRVDLLQEIDLIEEVTRVKGYDKVPVTVMPVLPEAGGNEPSRFAPQTVLSERLISSGFSEALNYSFAEIKELERLKIPVTMKVANPLSKENEVMRPSLLAGLLKNVLLNLRQGYGDVKLFETGTIFGNDFEKVKLGIIACGGVWPVWWGWEGKLKDGNFDYYYFSGIIQHVLSGNKLSFRENPKCAPYYHPGKNSLVEMNGKIVGETGMLHPDLSNEAGKEVCYCEIDLAALDRCWNRAAKVYEPVSRKPMVKRDISLIAKKSIPFSDISARLDKFSEKNSRLAGYELFSKYEDEKLGCDNVSYSFHLIFRDPENTLTDPEVNALFDSIVSVFNSDLGITLR